VRSYGGRGVADRSRWQTLNFPYTDTSLTQNRVIGDVVDMRGNSADATMWNRLIVTLVWPHDGRLDSLDYTADKAAHFDYIGIPQGTHRLKAMYFSVGLKDTFRTTQFVPVYPGVGAHYIQMRLPAEW
jgi:hypothetical protein